MQLPDLIELFRNEVDDTIHPVRQWHQYLGAGVSAAPPLPLKALLFLLKPLLFLL